MGRFYVAAALMSITAKSAEEVENVELVPMTPGRWAAWAKSWREEQAVFEPTSQDARPATPAAAPAPLVPVSTRS